MASEQQAEEYELPEVVELSPEEGRQLFDERVRDFMGMSGEEFLRKWDAGEIEDPDRSPIIELVMMIPFCGRPIVLDDIT